MAKNKIQRFAEVNTFPNCVFMSYKSAMAGDFHLKGKWHSDHFKNDHPIVVEFGCGKGDYTVGLARMYPEKNFIGSDIKGNRIWVGAKMALEEKLSNAGFLRTRIDFILSAFTKDEISEIWITFPDPQPTKKGERKRLTCPGFLDRYKQLLRPGGRIHLKTDNAPLYEYTLDVIKASGYKLHGATNDLYGNEHALPPGTAMDEARAIQTYYESRFIKEGFKICYLEFSFS